MTRTMNTLSILSIALLAISAGLIAFFQQPDPQSYFRRRLVTVNDRAASEGQRRHLLKYYGSTPTSNKLPLGECEGDCDKGKKQCGSGLVCFDKPPRTKVPGCDGGENDSSKADYCIREELANSGGNEPDIPAGSTRIKKIGNDLKNVKFDLCQGDCDSDSDCKGDLECFQRGKREKVIGCDGGKDDSSNWDFCVPPYKDTSGGGGDSPELPSTGLFRLKLYWEEGYFWQEETRERKWCAMYKYDGLPGSGSCWYGRKRKSCRDDQVYMAKCSNDSRQKFAFVKLSNSEVQIKVGNGGNKCFERDGRDIFLRTCDSKEEHQRWYAPNGNIDGSKFELTQRRYSSQCVTQDHHPKPGEVVELHSCSAARSKNHQTSFWTKY